MKGMRRAAKVFRARLFFYAVDAPLELVELLGDLFAYSYVDGDPISLTDPERLRRKPPPIPGDLGRYPYMPDAWRRNFYRDSRQGA